MYQTGDLLIYGSTGVCRVLSIDRRQDYVDGIKQDKLYYQLKPLHQGGVIYTPVDNSKVVMRPVISREEAEALIDTIPTLMLFKNGEVLGSVVAPASKAAIETFIQETLAQ